MNRVFIAAISVAYSIFLTHASAAIYQCPYSAVCNGVMGVCAFEPGLETTPIWHFAAPGFIPDRGPYSLVEARASQGQASCAYMNAFDILVISNPNRPIMPLLTPDSHWIFTPMGEYICRSADPEQCLLTTMKPHRITTEIYK